MFCTLNSHTLPVWIMHWVHGDITKKTVAKDSICSGDDEKLTMEIYTNTDDLRASIADELNKLTYELDKSEYEPNLTNINNIDYFTDELLHGLPLGNGFKCPEYEIIYSGLIRSIVIYKGELKR